MVVVSIYITQKLWQKGKTRHVESSNDGTLEQMTNIYHIQFENEQKFEKLAI